MRRHHLAGALIAAVVVAVVILFWPRKHAPEPPPVYGTVPEFNMVAETGKPLSSADLHGKVWAATFIFTRCTSVCPVLTEKVRQVQEGTQGDAEDVRLVSFTVDPAFDTPAVLAEYARAHHADPARWSFLTGDAAPIAAAMKIGLDRLPDKPPADSIIHGSHVVLVDRQMNIRGYYDTASGDNDDATLKRLIAQAKSLARE